MQNSEKRIEDARRDRSSSFTIPYSAFCIPSRRLSPPPLPATILGRVKITDIKATTVTVPLEAPLRHANGCHWGRFVRTVVEVETDEGITGLEEMRYKVSNPTASLYNNRTQVLAALEFACLDILGQKWNAPVHAILGGKLQDRVPFASYLFFRYPGAPGAGGPPYGAGGGRGEVRTIDQMV